MLNNNKKCTVVSRKVTSEDFKIILQIQKNTKKPNRRDGAEDAFEKTLRGSKVYLKERGLIK